jgi:hypothetical protein
MSGYILIPIVILAIIIFSWLMLRRKKAATADKRRERLPVDYPATFPHVYADAGRPKIQSITEVPEHARETVTNAVKSGVNVALDYFPHWQRPRIEDVFVTFIKSGGNGEDGLPDILIQGQRTAGTVIGTQGKIEWPQLEIILPSHAENNWQDSDYLWNSVYNEFEHWMEFSNDRAEALKFVGWSDSHPHRPVPDGVEIFPPVYPPNQSRGFAARVFDPNRQIRANQKCVFEVKK